MANMLWLNWSGGGNLPPSLGIARVLTERGHLVSFAGRPKMVSRVERAGFRAIELKRAYEQVSAYPAKWIKPAASFLTSPAVAEEIRQLLAAERPDLVIVDAMFPIALMEAARYGGPSLVMVHTCVRRMLPQWRKMLETLAALRLEAGFGSIPAGLDEMWMVHDRVLATTLGSLDEGPNELAHPERLYHAGPVLEQERHSIRPVLPWDSDDPRPLVLVSFSTMPEQGSVTKFQNAIDALSGLDVRGVVTVGDSIDANALKPSTNVAVFATADHDDLMKHASLVLTHGGHGTFMRALRNGLPMVVVPGLASDQPVNAVAAEAWGVGRGLPPDATVGAIAGAVRDVLASPSFAAKAQSFATELAGVDGAANAADEIEQLLAKPLRKAS